MPKSYKGLTPWHFCIVQVAHFPIRVLGDFSIERTICLAIPSNSLAKG